MYIFPKHLYSDVRIETVKKTDISVKNGLLSANRTRNETGALVRVYDGRRWYYSAVSDLASVQSEIDALAAMAEPNSDILNDPVVSLMETNTGRVFRYEATDLSLISNERKMEVLNSYIPAIVECPEFTMWRAIYSDNHTVKRIISSKGTDVEFDTQNCAVSIRGMISVDEKPTPILFDVYKMVFDELGGRQEELQNHIKEVVDYAKNAVPVVPGVYTCVLSPEVAGVFAHESFGHKSEADFMVGDETMMREWKLGSKVGSSILSIRESGGIEGSGYVPYDDEGTAAKDNYLIKDGVLVGRLHSGVTAASLGESLTGNARSIGFEYEPIVRMTTTYIDKGTDTKEQLISGVKRGIYIADLSHGSGMSTFTIAPLRAYMIEDGRITTPVKVSVISGNVMETLGQIDGLSDSVQICSFALGGCGKMEQFPLRVGFGGPYVRVNNIKVQ